MLYYCTQQSRSRNDEKTLFPFYSVEGVTPHKCTCARTTADYSFDNQQKSVFFFL